MMLRDSRGRNSLQSSQTAPTSAKGGGAGASPGPGAPFQLVSGCWGVSAVTARGSTAPMHMRGMRVRRPERASPQRQKGGQQVPATGGRSGEGG